MGSNDNRLSRKMRRRKAQVKKKLRLARKVTAAKAAGASAAKAAPAKSEKAAAPKKKTKKAAEPASE